MFNICTKIKLFPVVVALGGSQLSCAVGKSYTIYDESPSGSGD